MFKIIIWGIGLDYNEHINLIKSYEWNGEIKLIGITGNEQEYSTVDDIKFYKKNELNEIEYDACIVCVKDYNVVVNEAKLIGINREKLIPSRVLNIPGFNFEKYIWLKKHGVTILSRNCWAGLAYHFLDLEFCSPTINMFFEANEFNKFCINLNEYLNEKLNFVEMKYENKLNDYYPVGKLNDINIYFNHYKSFEEANLKWESRKKRIKNNIVVVQSASKEEDIFDFLTIAYKKVCFVPHDIEINKTDVIITDYLQNKDYTVGEYINGTAVGKYPWIRLIDFLYGDEYIRTS